MDQNLEPGNIPIQIHSTDVLKFIYLFIYFWLHWVFVAAHRLSLVAASGGYSSFWCTSFSLRWLLVVEHGL